MTWIQKKRQQSMRIHETQDVIKTLNQHVENYYRENGLGDSCRLLEALGQGRKGMDDVLRRLEDSRKLTHAAPDNLENLDKF